MQRSNKSNGKVKKQPARVKKASAKVKKVLPPPRGPRGYVIRIPDEDAETRAVMVLGDVGQTYYGMAPDLYLLTPAHWQALKDAGIPFEQLS
jgi:hypothetical protein